MFVCSYIQNRTTEWRVLYGNRRNITVTPIREFSWTEWNTKYAIGKVKTLGRKFDNQTK